MITYAANSSGEIIKVGMETPYFASERKRLEALNTIRLAVLPYLISFGANDKTFSVAIQPFGYEDRLIWFTKIHAESDSDIVKSSQNALRNKNHVYESKAEEYLFSSVLSVKEDGKDSWYLLYAESICFTRNIFDKKIISAVFEDPIPYGEFIVKNKQMQISKKEIILEERTDKMKYLSPKINFEDREKLLEIALPRTDDRNLDAYFREGLKNVLQAVEKRDKDSNKKTRLLAYLIDGPAGKRETDDLYGELSAWVKNDIANGNLKDTSCNGNIVTVSNGRDRADIYVCKRPDEQDSVYIVNGRVFDKTDLLKKYVESGHCYEGAPDWWGIILSKADESIGRNK